MRADGTAAASAVASVIALGSRVPAAAAASSQAVSWSHGVGVQVSSIERLLGAVLATADDLGHVSTIGPPDDPGMPTYMLSCALRRRSADTAS